jgi:hypothetical protein
MKTYQSMLIFVGVVGFWLLSFLVIREVFGEPADPGQFGDLFGAVNALFSGLAFAGLIVAITLQRKELRAVKHSAVLENARIKVVGCLRVKAIALELQTVLRYIDTFLKENYRPALAQAFNLAQDLRLRISAADAIIYDTEMARILGGIRSTLDQFTLHLGPDWQNLPPGYQSPASMDGGITEASGLHRLAEVHLDAARAEYDRLLCLDP